MPNVGKRSIMVDKVYSEEDSYFPHPPIHRFTSGIYPDFESLVYASQDSLKSRYPRYSRFGTPMTDTVECEITRLEGGYSSLSTCSGLAAITSVLMSFLRPGDHILMTRSVYEPVRCFVMTYLFELGISATFLSADEFGHLEDYVTDKTKLIYVESPSSNIFEVTDIDAVAKLARLRGIVTIIDNTWSTPLLLNPLHHGFDVVIHSASKYLAGHSDAVMGTITTTEQYYEPVRRYLIKSGVCAGGEESFSLYKGLKTLAVRLKIQQDTAQKLIRMLLAHPAISTVISPVLPSHSGHEIFCKYYRQSNGLFSFSVKKPTDQKRDDFLRELKTFKLAYGWGGVDSCMIPFRSPDWMTQDEEQLFLRVSVGIEDADMLAAELSSALSKL